MGLKFLISLSTLSIVVQLKSCTGYNLANSNQSIKLILIKVESLNQV